MAFVVKGLTMLRVGFGQDSHRFLPRETTKPCVIGGIIFEDVPGFAANSDGDVVFHAICNAITSLTHVLILGGIADDLCLKGGITDSRVYLEEAVKTLGAQKIVHVALACEGARPKLKAHFNPLRSSVASTLNISMDAVGITATTGEALTDFGRGAGLMCQAVLTTATD